MRQGLKRKSFCLASGGSAGGQKIAAENPPGRVPALHAVKRGAACTKQGENSFVKFLLVLFSQGFQQVIKPVRLDLINSGKLHAKFSGRKAAFA